MGAQSRTRDNPSVHQRNLELVESHGASAAAAGMHEALESTLAIKDSFTVDAPPPGRSQGATGEERYGEIEIKFRNLEKSLTSVRPTMEPDYSAVIGTRNNNTPSRSSSLNSRDAVHHAFEDKSSGLDIAEGTTISYYTDNIDEDQPPPRTENSGSDSGTSKRELLQVRAPPSEHDGVSAGAAIDNSTLTATDDEDTRRRAGLCTGNVTDHNSKEIEARKLSSGITSTMTTASSASFSGTDGFVESNSLLAGAVGHGAAFSTFYMGHNLAQARKDLPEGTKSTSELLELLMSNVTTMKSEEISALITRIGEKELASSGIEQRSQESTSPPSCVSPDWATGEKSDGNVTPLKSKHYDQCHDLFKLHGHLEYEMKQPPLHQQVDPSLRNWDPGDLGAKEQSRVWDRGSNGNRLPEEQRLQEGEKVQGERAVRDTGSHPVQRAKQGTIASSTTMELDLTKELPTARQDKAIRALGFIAEILRHEAISTEECTDAKNLARAVEKISELRVADPPPRPPKPKQVGVADRCSSATASRSGRRGPWTRLTERI